MSNLKQQWEDKLYRNWLRGSLGLKFLKEGIEDLVDSSVKDLHARIKSVVAAPGSRTLQCGVCTLNNLLPDHAGGRCKQNTRGQCFCNKPIGRRKCPNGICSVLYDLIIDSHLTRDPSWKNTDVSMWVSDHWQVAKCFMGPVGFAACAGSAKDTDAAGLLSVAINAADVASQFSCGLHVLKQMRDARNKILHSPSLILQDKEVSGCIDQMIQLLLDPIKLVHDIAAQNAVRHLRNLKNTTCFISTKNEKEIRKQALQAIKESKEIALEEIKKAELKAIDKIETFKFHLGGMMNVNEQKQDMLRYLLSTYKRYEIGVDISPALPGKEVNIDDIYVPVDMMTVSEDENLYYSHYYNIRDSPKDVSKYINLENMSLNMKNVFILAKAGMGKTTFCRHLISEWCKQQSGVPGNNSINCLNGVDFLFFVSLKYVNEETTVEQMIKQHLFDTQFHDLVDYVLMKEPNNCLVILDGLDEWTPPRITQKSPRVSAGLPVKEVKSGYATIYTTRPWKYATIKPRDCEVDIKVEIIGIPQELSTRLAELVFKKLNKVFKKNVTPSEFVHDLRSTELVRLRHIPLLLLLLACLWYNTQKFESSLSGIYSSIIEWFLTRAENRRRSLLYDRALKDKDDDELVPLCFKEKIKCRKYFTSLLVPLARFSFETMFNHNNSHLVFKTDDFQSVGLESDCISALLNTGLLTEHSEVVGQMTGTCYRSFAFIHKNFQEFFAALGIAIGCPVQQLSAERHLEMSQVYHFLSGINGRAMANLSNDIGTAVDKNENNIKYRRGISTYTGFVAEMHLMILSCLRETVITEVPPRSMVLRDIYASKETAHLLPYLTEIDMSKVVSLYCDCAVTYNVCSCLENICDLELFVCRDSFDALYVVLKRCAQTIKCVVLSEIDLTGYTTLNQLDFVQLTNITLFKVIATRSQICRIYLCSPRLVSVCLDTCEFIKETHSSAYEIKSENVANVQHLNVVRCDRLPINEIQQPRLRELVWTNADCLNCADLVRKCTGLRLIALTDTDLRETHLPDLFPSNLIDLETVHLKNIKISCSDLCFHLEALLRLRKLDTAKLDHVYLISESAETVQKRIKRLEIKVPTGETKRYVTISYEALETEHISLLSIHLRTKNVMCTRM